MKNILPKDKIDEIRAWCSLTDISKYTINSDGSLDVHQDVIIDFNRVDGLPYKFNVINGDFTSDHNELTNMDNMPVTVNGDFSIATNDITSLEGCPRYIKGDFSFNNNFGLSSTYVGDYDVIVDGDFFVYDTGLPQEFMDEVENSDNGQSDTNKLRMIFKYQRHFNIWNADNTLDIPCFQELLDEINDGLE